MSLPQTAICCFRSKEGITQFHTGVSISEMNYHPFFPSEGIQQAPIPMCDETFWPVQSGNLIQRKNKQVLRRMVENKENKNSFSTNKGYLAFFLLRK